jgi:hypothetical protein
MVHRSKDQSLRSQAALNGDGAGWDFAFSSQPARKLQFAAHYDYAVSCLREVGKDRTRQIRRGQHPERA